MWTCCYNWEILKSKNTGNSVKHWAFGMVYLFIYFILLFLNMHQANTWILPLKYGTLQFCWGKPQMNKLTNTHLDLALLTLQQMQNISTGIAEKNRRYCHPSVGMTTRAKSTSTTVPIAQNTCDKNQKDFWLAMAGLEFWCESEIPLSQRLAPNISARIQLVSHKRSKVSHKPNRFTQENLSGLS